MSARRLASYAFLAAAAALLAGRLFGLPVALLVVGGRSMEPALSFGDLLVGVRAPYREGDIVVRQEHLTYCVVHRVVEVAGDTVVTKGDANPLPDPPAPAEQVKYKVVAVVPRHAWVPVAVVLIAAYAAARRDKVRAFLSSYKPGELSVAYTALLSFLALNLAVIALVPVHYASHGVSVPRPSVELKYVDVSKDGSLVTVGYSLSHVAIEGVAKALVRIANTSYPCQSATCATRGFEGFVRLAVPREAYEYAYEVAAREARLIVNVTLDKGWLLGEYSYPLNWRPLGVEVAGAAVAVSNPNYVPVNFSARVVHLVRGAPFGAPEVVESRDLGSRTVEPGSSVEIPVEAIGDYAYVEVRYRFMGEDFLERRLIDFYG